MKHITRIVLVVATAAAAVTGLGAATAAASGSTSSDSYTVEAFRETIKPWDSITIPSLTCPTGYLENVNLSPGRIVPNGVEVTGDSGPIGTTIAHVKSIGVTNYWNQIYHPAIGTQGTPSSATNWDPFSSHELVVNLRCTTDLNTALTDPVYG